jgi:hypothetical protein
MNYTRCLGWMIKDHFLDFEGTEGYKWMEAWRCLNCGHAVDPVIEANHRLTKARVPAQSCREPESELTRVAA